MNKEDNRREQLIDKTILKQDNGKMVVVNKKKTNNSKVPSEWTNKKMSKYDINAINKRLGKKKKRK